MIKGLYNYKTPVKYTGEERINEIMNTIADISRAKKVLDWEPKTSFFDGLPVI